MVEKVSEGLSEERALLDYSFHCTASTRVRPSNVSCSHQTWLFPTNSNMTKVRPCLAFPCSLSLFLSPCYLFLVSLSVMQLLNSLQVGLFCSIESVMMSGRKETHLGQADKGIRLQASSYCVWLATPSYFPWLLSCLVTWKAQQQLHLPCFPLSYPFSPPCLYLLLKAENLYSYNHEPRDE